MYLTVNYPLSTVNFTEETYVQYNFMLRTPGG